METASELELRNEMTITQPMEMDVSKTAQEWKLAGCAMEGRRQLKTHVRFVQQGSIRMRPLLPHSE